MFHGLQYVSSAASSPGGVNLPLTEKEVDFLLSEQELPFRNEALLDVVTRRPACFFGKLVSAQT
jgi:hypothetical protein